MGIDPKLAAAIRSHNAALKAQAQQISMLQQLVADLSSRPRSVEEEIDAIPGRVIESMLSGEVTFASTDAGNRGTPIIMQVSQDGPFVMTHYPVVHWFPSLPTTATNFNVWRPVQRAYLPTQTVTTDFIDIKYEITDGGAGRLFQNAPRGPMFSRADNLVMCPRPTVWSPNSNVIFTPTYLAISFTGATPPTQGTLHVDIPGFRVINL